MRRLIATAVFVLVPCFPPAPACAGVAVGDDAPAVEGREFINTEPFKIEDLRGNLVIVELFRTSSQQCSDQVAKLDELLDKYGDRGLVVLAVTNEERKAVDEFVAKLKPRHSIVIESGDSTKSYGLVKGFPTAYLIGPDGKIAWTGNWADKADIKIELLLPKAKRSPRLPLRFAAARDAAEAGRLMEARRPLEAEMKAGKVTEAEKPAVRNMIAWIDKVLAKQLDDAVAAANSGNFYEAAVDLERLAKECPDLDVGKGAAEGLRQLLSDPARKREVDAGRQLAAAIESAKSLTGRKAIPLYKAVIAKWKDTKAAKQAAELIAALEKPDAGKPK